MIKFVTFGVIFLVLFSSLSASAFSMEKYTFESRGNILYVGGNGPENYTTIHDAVANASEGDTIFVYAGTYMEYIYVDKPLTLQGQNEATTIIDATNNCDRLLYVNTSDFSIDDFTLLNCYNPVEPGFSQAICVKKYHQNIRFSNCNFSYNDKGIYFENVTDLSFQNCVFFHNRAQSLWGINTTNVSINNCTFDSNGHNIGGGSVVPGGISLENADDIVLHQCILTKNIGNGVELFAGSDISITETSIGRSSWDGIYVWNINNCDLFDNKISSSGFSGADISLSPILTITNNNFSSNHYNGLNTDISNLNITNNSFYYNGCGVNMNGPLSIIKNNTFIGNNIGCYFGYLATYAKIQDNYFSDNNQTGIEMADTIRTQIINNTISRSKIGIDLSSAGSVITHNYIHDIQTGVQVLEGSGFSISSNTISNVSDSCVDINTSHGQINDNNFLNYSSDPHMCTWCSFNNYLSNRIQFKGNYWGKPLLKPKILINKWIPKYKIKHLNKQYILLKVIDWHPARTPYENL